MEAPYSSVRFLERYSVGPPPGSVQEAPPLPLTLFDIFWYPLEPVKLVNFYHLPFSTGEFFKSQLPVLKQSLSLTLQRFYPLAGRLLHPNGERFPCLCYSEGDTVEFSVAESFDDFRVLTADSPKAASRFRGLAPILPKPEKAEFGEPVVALQATLFPNQGISLGITLYHVAMDGATESHFMRTWGAMCRGEAGSVELPCFDRTVVKECTDGKAEALFARTVSYLRDRKVPDVTDTRAHDDGLFRATFRLSTPQIEDLRSSISTTSPRRRCSSFALVAALVWTSRLKAQESDSDVGDCVRSDGEAVEWFVFATDMRARFQPPIPSAYFGNFLGSCRVSLRRADLVGEDGLRAAADAVQGAVEALREPEGVRRITEVLGSGMTVLNVTKPAGQGRRPLSVAGSTRNGMYHKDFGWGRPLKVEVVSIETTGAMAVADKDGVIEVGVVLTAQEMETFTSITRTRVSSMQNDCRSRM